MDAVTTIKIRETTINGKEVYLFKPVGYIDGFYEQIRSWKGLGFHKPDKSWTLLKLVHRGNRKALVAQFEGVFGHKCLSWSGDNAEPHQQAVGLDQVQKHLDNSWLLPHWQEAIHRTEEQLRVLRYSWRTVKSYLSHLKLFLHAHNHLVLEEIDNNVLRSYIVCQVKERQYSEATQNQLLNAIKFWLEKVEGREKAFIDLRPKKAKKLPSVLSQEEVVRLFEAVDNLKHRCILKIIYGGGLRLSELINLRVADIHSDRLQIFVHGGKGKKDRYTTMPRSLLYELRNYYRQYRPNYWLFEGQTGGQYSARSVQNILRRAVKKSGVNPFATVHTLRHSYATHLLEQGTSLRHIQDLLGHASSITTEIYTHISTKERQQVISPLDNIGNESVQG